MKTNFLANLGKALTVAGATSFAVGFTGATIHQMNKGGHCSIFGGCGSPFGFNMGTNMFGGCGCNNMFGMNNMYGFNMMGGNYNMYGMNNLYTQYGNESAAAWGANLFDYFMAQASNTNTNNNYTKHQDAGAIDKNEDKAAGAQFSAALSEMGDDKRDSHIISNNSESDNKSQYKEAVSKLGKSYLADIDQCPTSTNDGIVTREEFVKYELKNSLPEGATDQDGQELSLAANTLFAKLDMNGDRKLDWKEASAAIATYDTDSSGKRDGKITSTDAKRWLDAALDSNDTSFTNQLNQNYNNLFGSDQ